MLDTREALEQLHTLADYVRWGASRFREAGLVFGHGTDNALDEAAALVLHTLHLAPEIPETYWHTRLTRSEGEAIMARMQRRIDERVPVAYLTSEAWFLGLPFYVDRRVLVPRSPVAELVENGFAPWLEADAVRRVLDLGTGSGCIAVTCAMAFDEAEVDASDISQEALEVARINIARYGLEHRVQTVRADVFDGLLPGRRYDLIVANPPYVDARDMARLPREYRHEPELGLAAGDDGLTVVRRILAGAHERLTPDGLLVVEVGNSAHAVAAAWPQVPFTWLDFQRGGEGVFALTAADVADHADALAAD
ncbi:MAG: 50S ribosomal protein L3 N(5)-glutamine methyltransferase [Ectothiorhodospiraceae bacterium]